MVKKVIYQNNSTGEITESHKQAVAWYNQKNEITIYQNGQKRLTWEH